MSERVRLLATGLPAGAISTTESTALTEGWTVASTEPGACDSPGELPDSLEWRSAAVPGTVAQSVGPDDLDRHEDYDASDWWYRCEVPGPEPSEADAPGRTRLRFDGLTTLAQVWLNGELVLESSNMFQAHEVDVTDLVRGDDDLVLVFRSLGAALSERRPRPRWKTNLVDEQHLRWFRTTLLGRIPGWTPAIKPVGPWRGVWLERVSVADVETLDIRAGLDGSDGVVHVGAVLKAVDEGVRLRSASIRVGGSEHPVEVEADGDRWGVHGMVSVREPALWWPATHGEPALHDCALVLDTSAGPVTIDCGRVGFRDVRLDTSDGRIQLVVNGVPVFCRGACWTSNDIVSLVGSSERMRRILGLAAEAHANMVRVGGTMVYETDEFYRTCDELGLMVFQDFMFANMDYPVDDEAFEASVRAEADQQLRRIARHASAVAYCGGSEVEQQAAMFGAPREIWSNDFFSGTLPELLEKHAPGTPYWPSTPTGGALPFHVGEGLTHYYGVGAYKRPLSDVRLAGVRFTPETLGFSHVPEPENLRKLTPSGAVPPHHPEWKRGVPRDTGPGWDFEDIRDHYLELLYGVDAVQLRSEDLDRYLELSRIVTGEVLEAVFAEWRRGADLCGGALVWFLNDLRPGAGWGLIDSDGEPKAALHRLRGAWAPQCVRLLDRGLDGVLALAINETETPFDGRLRLTLVGSNGRRVGETDVPLRIAPRSSSEQSVDAAFGYFADPTYSYRFGPRRHQAVAVRLVESRGGAVVSECTYRSGPSRLPREPAIEAVWKHRGPDDVILDLTSDHVLFDVRLHVRDYVCTEAYFSLAPGWTRSLRFRRIADSARPLRAYVEASNLQDPLTLPDVAPPNSLQQRKPT